MRVLIAEDEALVRRHIADLLTQMGCLVVSQHGDGESAVRWLEDNPGGVDALFLDVVMPHMTGLEVAAWPGARDLPTVFISAWGDYAIQAFEVSAVDYLQKPVSPGRVQRSVDRLMAMHGGPAAQTTPMVHIRAGRSRDGVVGVESVEAFEVEDREVFAWSDGKRYLALGFRTLKEVEKGFPAEVFNRIGRNRLERAVSA